MNSVKKLRLAQSQRSLENVYKEVSTLAEKHGFQDWSFWIGIHDISTEGHFVYNSDNSPG